jgi:4-amino-4-deoxy-L-arabinose transferase-like glycosyltransferase
LRKTGLFFLLLFALLAAVRMCHFETLWAEETLPLAAAQQMRAGHVLYRDIWFDKPPLMPVLYTALGGEAGWRLRLAGALYALLCCWIAWGFARDLWGRREGFWAAGLLAFFLIFDFPSAAIPLATDLLMLAPHLAAVWMAYRRRPLWAGVLAGVAFTISPKGVLVLAVCAWWAPSWALLAGFLGVAGAASACLWSAGALTGYWDEVWRWGRVYAGTTFVESPLKNGLLRTLNWAGFHAAIVVAAAMAWKSWWGRRFRLPTLDPLPSAWQAEAPAPPTGLSPGHLNWLVWLALSVAGVAAGLRFFPRYYFQLLPVVVLLAARGFAEMRGRLRLLALLLLLIPLGRFAPTYYMAARDAGWRDTAMDRDSRAAAAIVRAAAQPGDTLFVWGFRPEIYVYAHLPAATRFLDSQPLTGVPADRHLTQSTPIETTESRARRTELAAARPTFVVDGLGEYNPRLALTTFDDLGAWMAAYREVGRTSGSVIYRRE